MVIVKKERNLNDRRYINYFYYDSRFDLNLLIHGGNFVRSHCMFQLKEWLNLPDHWMNAKTGKYRDLQWKDRGDGYMEFWFKGNKSSYGGSSMDNAIHEIHKLVKQISQR